MAHGRDIPSSLIDWPVLPSRWAAFQPGGGMVAVLHRGIPAAIYTEQMLSCDWLVSSSPNSVPQQGQISKIAHA
ncbi:hypothetical protein Sinac_4783 [Singulisphaera acidiphila DSM 18658]|uniref:Uncharacterized protein n=1 Tax=Singulisphaera acidiphila (strain ATCC BAA-1392 / DSM 18658 / VKM B-2454 / MOB10) TaxID=886293 RepID=L0DJF3_SINAD|nr:hypothetical protein Sinac_4783 [Singulisphaera acidiphila DSM 18658]